MSPLLLDKAIQSLARSMRLEIYKLFAGRCPLEDADIEQKFHFVQKEIEATVSLTEECKLNLVAAIDWVKIELEVLKDYMERYHPGFAASYAKFKEEALQAIDPEWIGSERGKRLERR